MARAQLHGTTFTPLRWRGPQAEIHKIRKAFPGVKFTNSDPPETAETAFALMATADVLIAGRSGFGLLAGVVSDGVVLAPQQDKWTMPARTHAIENNTLVGLILINAKSMEHSRPS